MSFASLAGLEVKATKGGPPLVGPDHSPTSGPPGAEPPASSAADVVVRGGVDDATLAALCERVRAALDGGTELVVCDVRGLSEGSVAAISLLARLQLTARRLGGRVRVRNASPELHDLLALAGLCDVVGACPPLSLDARRESEEWEELLCVQEERDPTDPVP